MIYGYLRNRPTDKRDFIGLFDDGGYVCLEKQGVYEYVPSVGFVYKEVCVAWEYKKGHKDFPNNGTNCPFDYTAEDNSIWTSPFTPWGLWRHFRSMEDVISDIFDLLEKPRCDAKRFQSLMHQLQDFFTHYNRSGEVFSCEIKWRWYTLGHLLGGTAPDLDDFAQGDAFDDAKTMTEYMLKIWHDNCILCSTAPCEWKPNPARKTGSGNMPSAPDLKTWKPESK